jgi:hypothetical protein
LWLVEIHHVISWRWMGQLCRAVVPKRCVATPWCVGRDHEVCREIKKNI